MLTDDDRFKFDITTRQGLANWLELHIDMLGNVALTRLLNILESMYPDVNVYIPRDFTEFIVRELDNIELYVVGQTVRVTRLRV